MRFRMRRKKQALGYKDISYGQPEQVATVARSGDIRGDSSKEKRALQKVFASQLVRLSRKHLGENANTQANRRRPSLADVSISVESNFVRKQNQPPIRRTRSELPQPEPKTPFQMACGGGAEDVSDVRNDAQQQHSSHDNEGRSSVPFNAPPKVIRCSGAEESSVTMPTFSSNCFLFGDFCPTSLFQQTDSQHGERGGEEYGSPLQYACRLLRTNPFARQKPNIKKNGIPKVISIPTAPVKLQPKKSGCFTPLGCFQDNSVPLVNEGRENIHVIQSMDSSLVRLEDTLMKANLNADIEEKYATPMHEARGRGRGGDMLDQTADATTVTSSLSTHSSFRVGASIIRLPEKLSPMI